MSQSTIARAARSLLFRQRLVEGIPALEHKLRSELQERNTEAMLVPGFRVFVEDSQLKIVPRDNVCPGQMELPIDATDEQIEEWMQANKEEL